MSLTAWSSRYISGRIYTFQCLSFHLQLTVRINLIFYLCILIQSGVRVRVTWDQVYTISRTLPSATTVKVDNIFEGLINSRCSGEEPAFLRGGTWTLESGRRKSSLIYFPKRVFPRGDQVWSNAPEATPMARNSNGMQEISCWKITWTTFH